MSDLPAVFMPYQQLLAEACDTDRVVVVEKSRRTGYSWAAAAIAAMRAAAARGAGGSDVFYMGYNLEMAREFIGYVAGFARQITRAAVEVAEQVFPDPDHPDRAIRAFRVDFASGFEVLALPSVPRALRGRQGFVIIDEAAFHDDLPEVLKSAFALLIWGGAVLVISTHDGDLNPFNTLVTDIRAGRLPYRLLRCTFDDALRDGLFRRICRTTGRDWSEEAEAAWRAQIVAFYGDAAAEELDCVPAQSSGAYLPGPLVEARADPDVPVRRWACGEAFTQWPDHLRAAECRDWCARELDPVLEALDADCPHVFGEDFGRSGDLTVIWVLAIGRDLVRRTAVVVELRGVPFRQQEQVLFHLCDRLPKRRAGAMDARGNGQYLAEVAQQRYGAQVAAVMLSEAWYREQMPPFKAAFEDGGITIPRDRDIHGDLRALRLVRGVARVPDQRTSDATGQRHGDAAVAAALAYAASRAEPEVYDYAPVRRADHAAPPSAAGGWPVEDELAEEARRARAGARRVYV